MLYLHKCQHFFHFFYTEKEYMRNDGVVQVFKLVRGFFDSLFCKRHSSDEEVDCLLLVNVAVFLSIRHHNLLF